TVFLMMVFALSGSAQSGYRLWLDYKPLDTQLAEHYRAALQKLVFPVANETDSIAKKELLLALGGLLDFTPEDATQADKAGTLLVGTPSSLPELAGKTFAGHLPEMGDEGFGIYSA